jgi:small subunit ribosomal protein S2
MLKKVNAQIGRKLNLCNPKMVPYLCKEQNGLHIIDLLHTKKALNYAQSFLSEAYKKKKTFLFVGTKPSDISDIIETEAKRCGAFYVNKR